MTDFKLTADGDLAVSNGDLALVNGQDEVMQQGLIRLKTTSLETSSAKIPYPDLFELRGMPNTRDTADEGTRRITRALTASGLIKASDLLVRAIPLAESTISWFVYINSGDSSAEGFQVTLDLNRGVIVQGVRE